jgi:hypothetical protein
MIPQKPGPFFAFLDVESLERRFPPFPDGSDGIFEHASPLTEFFRSLFGTGPNTTDSGFTDGSDGSFYPTRTRERKTPNENKDYVFHDNYYFVRRPDVGKKASDPSEPPKPVFCSLRSDLDRITADLAGASRIALRWTSDPTAPQAQRTRPVNGRLARRIKITPDQIGRRLSQFKAQEYPIEYARQAGGQRTRKWTIRRDRNENPAPDNENNPF